MSKAIELKIWSNYFDAINNGIKTFEIRKNDRDFEVGDTLILREWIPGCEKYTGRRVAVKITYILPGGQWGVDNDYCVMAIEKNK